MKLRESILIHADAAAVWPLVADPRRQADWNPKIVSIDRHQPGPVQYGEQFEMIYRMSGRENLSKVEVTLAEPPVRLAWLHRVDAKSRTHQVEESYVIEPKSDHVQVTQSIDLGKAGIPWLFRPLIWFLHRFGNSTDEPYLRKLKRLAERTAQEH